MRAPFVTRAMEPYGRAPSPHLIDNLVKHSERRWLHYYFDVIASTTRFGDGDEDAVLVARRIWYRDLTDPATMEIVTIKIVLDENDYEIVTAYPI